MDSNYINKENYQSKVIQNEIRTIKEEVILLEEFDENNQMIETVQKQVKIEAGNFHDISTENTLFCKKRIKIEDSNPQNQIKRFKSEVFDVCLEESLNEPKKEPLKKLVQFDVNNSDMTTVNISSHMKISN